MPRTSIEKIPEWVIGASSVRLADRHRFEQACNPLLRNRQFAPGLVQLLLQVQEFGTDVPRPWGVRVAHVGAAVRADVYESLSLEHSQRSRHRVTRDSVRIFELPVRREPCTGRVCPVLDVCAELASHAPAVTALRVCVRHSAIVPNWLTPKLLTTWLSYNYCHKPVNCHAPVSATEGHSERSPGGSMTEYPNETIRGGIR
jgi:hypothetical protein